MNTPYLLYSLSRLLTGYSMVRGPLLVPNYSILRSQPYLPQTHSSPPGEQLDGYACQL